MCFLYAKGWHCGCCFSLNAFVITGVVENEEPVWDLVKPLFSRKDSNRLLLSLFFRQLKLCGKRSVIAGKG